MGAWIETCITNNLELIYQSHPMWVRGLKHSTTFGGQVVARVAPYVGAWIETISSGGSKFVGSVAPYVGAWIETDKQVEEKHSLQVAPYVGAWIETISYHSLPNEFGVAPYVGAWIETAQPRRSALRCLRRTLCGCVD